MCALFDKWPNPFNPMDGFFCCKFFCKAPTDFFKMLKKNLSEAYKNFANKCKMMATGGSKLGKGTSET